METLKTDFLVVGTGIAGLSYTLRTAQSLPGRHITLLCKSEPKETNTRYAQGGIAVSAGTKGDSQQHISDTLKAGDGLCNEQVVALVVKEGPKRLRELIANGVRFDRNQAGDYDLAKEGGHSARRIYHRRDYTGLEIERRLLAKVRKLKNVRILAYASAIDLITDASLPAHKKAGKTTCYGAYVLLEKRQKIVAVRSAMTVLAAGGAGQVFRHSTNSGVATGDGIAIAHRAGAEIKNMAFIQFHPTALYESNTGRDFLISEALRGFGAILRNSDGEAFMRHYDPAGDLATRDIVARAIKTELDKSQDACVYLDCRHISKKEMAKHFPTILSRCISLNIDPSKKMIPVVPSAHYCCGGIVTDLNGRTTVANLYACGECAETGLHGANRLASNSLLEALVFAHRCSSDSVKRITSVKPPYPVSTMSLSYIPEQESREANEYIRAIKQIMSGSAGILTTDKKIAEGLKSLKQVSAQLTYQRSKGINSLLNTANNMLETAILILQDSQKRTENAGVFYNTDRAVSSLSDLKIKAAIRTDKNPAPV